MLFNNYGGKQSGGFAVNKTFYTASPNALWKRSNGALTPINCRNILVQGTIFYGALSGLSDIQVKSNIQPIESTSLMDLKPCSFTYNKDKTNKVHYGFIAQEMEKIYPELISVHENTHLKSIQYVELIPLLVYHIQQLQKEVDELKGLLKKS